MAMASARHQKTKKKSKKGNYVYTKDAVEAREPKTISKKSGRQDVPVGR
jgi:hypothetical protein